jgi:hypothetical protein
MVIELSRKPTQDEVEQICVAAEEAARTELLRKVSLKRVSDLDVTIEALGDKPLILNIDVSVELLLADENLQAFVDKATHAAFAAAESKVRELNLCQGTPA